MLEKKNVWETSYLVLSVPKTLRLLRALTVSQNIISPLAPHLCSCSLISSDVKHCFAFASREQTLCEALQGKSFPLHEATALSARREVVHVSLHVSCAVLVVAGCKSNKRSYKLMLH